MYVLPQRMIDLHEVNRNQLNGQIFQVLKFPISIKNIGLYLFIH